MLGPFDAPTWTAGTPTAYGRCSAGAGRALPHSGRAGHSCGMTVAGDLSFEPLAPMAFLDRAAAAHGDRIAVVDGDRRFRYAQLHERCRRLAGALAPLAAGRPVAVLAPNTHVLLEAHFGV